MKYNAIGLVGGLASGKDSFGKFIECNYGGRLVTTSDVSRIFIRDNNMGEATRDLTREVSSRLRAKKGADFLLRQSLENVSENELAIVSGLYVVEEVICLRAIRNCIIVRVDTSLDIREARAINRSRSSDECDPKNFHRLNNEDMNGTITDQKLSDVMNMADISVNGDIPIKNDTYWSSQAERIFNTNLLEVVDV